jgi:MFS family permease
MARRLPLPELSVMRLREYRLWWFSSASVLLNQFMTQITLAWLILEMTDSAAWVSYAVFAFGLPAFFITIPAGVLADRWDRRKQLILAQSIALANAAALAIAAGTGIITPHMALGFAMISGATVAISQPARQSLIPMLVPREHLMNGIVWGSLSQNLSQMTGPLFAGVLIATISASASFTVLSILLVVGIVCIVAMRVPAADPDAPPRPRFRPADLLGGFAFLRQTRPLFVLMLLYLATGIWIGGAIQALVPVLVKNYYHAGASGLGFAYTVQAVAAIVTSLWTTQQGNLKNKGALFAFGMMLGSSALIGYGLAPTYAIALVFFAAFGCATSFYSNMSQTILQTHSPPEVLGRVIAIITLSIQGFIPLGALQAGQIADVFDARTAAVYGGAMAFTMAAAVFAFYPRFRQLS